MQQKKIYLNVPYKEKDEAHNLGAEWDPQVKAWFCTVSPEEYYKFNKWMPNIIDINSEKELAHFVEQLDNPDFEIHNNDVFQIHNITCPECSKGYIIVKKGPYSIFGSCSTCEKNFNSVNLRDFTLTNLSNSEKSKFITNNPITKYLKNALSAQNNPTIDFKTDKFVIEPTTLNIENGFLNPVSTKELFETDTTEETNQKNAKPKTQLEVIIALKTFSTIFKNSSYRNINAEKSELTSFLFLPAILDISGKLYLPESGKLPWIPREYLSPMIEADISVGTEVDYDNFLKNSTGERNNIEDDWKKYLNYAKEMYHDVTGNSYENTFIEVNNQKIELENQYYVFIDTSVNASKNILKLYTYLENHQGNELYSTITSLKPTPSRPHFGENSISQMMKHVGQMGGEYPLSPSQREAIHTFAELKEGEVLAVSGPPGTGKTTLLQSVVANMLVEHALQEKKPPIIVAASTNNQAVTNIVSSFEKINAVGIRNLEKRWICGVKNFATYFPSKAKVDEAIKKDYQWTNTSGVSFFQNVEAEENRKQSKKLFIKEFSTFFNNSFHSFTSAKALLLNELRNIDANRKKILSLLETLKTTFKTQNCNSYYEYISNLDTQINSLQINISNYQQEIEILETKKQYFFTRMKEWAASYDSLSIFLKFFSFIPFCKRKLLTWFTSFQQEEELEFFKEYVSIEEIQNTYRNLIEKNGRTIDNIKALYESDCQKIQSIEEEKIFIQTQYQELVTLLEAFKKYGIFTNPKDYETALNQFDIKKLNNLFDCKIRYIEFWLAVHYYEDIWLSEELSEEYSLADTPTVQTLKIFFERIAMLSPCMVMTFFMLPKQFYIYANKLNHYMINYIDLLIVDEAGQTSPEIAAASFSLAKKAIVVGDEKQIPPVWGTERVLDISMAISNRVINTEYEFKLLEENGLNCSQSSIMKVATMSCPYEKYEKGLFLSEHRRCYNEIVKYCNDLVYGGRLEPMRGSYDNNNNSLRGYLPAMGHKNIGVSHSKRTGTSRCNEAEAEQIALWLQNNFPVLLERYQNTNPKEILGIITPFKAQSALIKRKLKKYLSHYAKAISVGTVHSFQGAEYKIIIFSSVYGNQDGCFFINKNDSLMNVAVSRAKDSFLVFGDRDCLIGGANEAGPLLKIATQEEI